MKKIIPMMMLAALPLTACSQIPTGIESMNQREVAGVVCEFSSIALSSKNKGENEANKVFNMAIDKLSAMPNLDPQVADVLSAGRQIKNLDNQVRNTTHNASMKAMDEACRRL